ncbi:NUDIX hydrolase [Arthrobacter cavernae]|uniref:CoA pyrophosphatase n=1 Tax=Arthrobacter cavernae TaxID=2817681 RepID=A0A939HHW5_9MICC|nr:CoA pyrophosphatase [Arthrobacter cavernae]MBO1267608.1 CoA pyrophosphatase [Arthrobacter cavernae]
MTALEDLAGLITRFDAGGEQRSEHWAQLAVGEETNRPAAVLMLFGVLDDIPAESGRPIAPADLDVLLLERAHTLDDHPGQVAFPGGSVDPEDDSVVAAALREAVEETGLDAGGVQVLGVIPELGLAHSNFRVTPVLAWWASPSPVHVVDHGESAQVFRVPVRDLLDPDNRVTATITRFGRTFRSPGFTVNGVVVWGFTGMVLSGLFDELGWTVPWDEERLVEIDI